MGNLVNLLSKLLSPVRNDGFLVIRKQLVDHEVGVPRSILSKHLVGHCTIGP